jgi:hypothetical protein
MRIALTTGTVPVEYPGLLEDIAEVDVGVQEVGVQGHRLLEVVDGQPYFSLAPGNNSIKNFKWYRYLCYT